MPGSPIDGGIVTRLDCIPLGIVVNKKGQRFGDEGEDLWPRRYAEWGSLVARQPDQTAFVVLPSQMAQGGPPGSPRRGGSGTIRSTGSRGTSGSL